MSAPAKRAPKLAAPPTPLSPAVIAIIDTLALARAKEDDEREVAAILARADRIMQGP